MKRFAVLLLILLGGGWFLWHAYDVGWLVSPLKSVARTAADAGHQRPADAEAPAAEAGRRARSGDGSGAAGRGRGGGGARFRGGSDGPVSVLVAAARVEDVPVTIDTVGTIQALNTVTVRPQIDGRLTELTFKDGQDVKRGDILARIDPRTYQAQYDQVAAKKAQDEAQLANARRDLERYAKLATTEYGSRQQADTQRATVAQLEAQLRVDQGAIDNAQAILDYTTIRSPLDGRTGIRLIDAGNIVHAADSSGIVMLTQLQPIAMVFNLPQQQLAAVNAALARGAVAVVALDADNVTGLDTGIVEVVDNQVDQTTGTVKIKADFPNARFQLWPGQFVNVRLTVDVIRQAIVIPTAAVQRGPNGPYAYVLSDGGTVRQTSLTIGRQDEAKAIVQAGLTLPAQVVTAGTARLTDGATVTVATADEAAGRPARAGDDAASTPGAPPETGERRHRHRRPAQPSDAGEASAVSDVGPSPGAVPPGAGSPAQPPQAGAAPPAPTASPSPAPPADGKPAAEDGGGRHRRPPAGAAAP